MDSCQDAKYNAFLSYSHVADRKLAPFLQAALHRFAKPWYKPRAVRVFRDETNLSVNPDLWHAIEAALSDSEYMLFLASPEAAASKWVRKELNFWCMEKDPQKLFILLTDGEFAWSNERGSIDWEATTAVPHMSEIETAIRSEPLWIDFR